MNQDSHSIVMRARKDLLEMGFNPVDEEHGASQKTFSDGAHYGIEIASVQSPTVLDQVLQCLPECNLTPSRFTETRGVFRLSDSEIKEMVDVCTSRQCGLVLSVGPRAFYDTSASARTPQGGRISYRLRGANNLVYALEDIYRATELGVRGILIYDEGLLYMVNKLRAAGKLPTNLYLKVSVHCGHGNPASMKLLEENGAGSVNVVGDLSVGMVAACRSAIDIPIDIHTDTPQSSGGFIRTYEVPALVRAGAPIFLKAGAVTSPNHAHMPQAAEVRARIAQASRVQDTIQKYAPWAKVVSQSLMCIPEP